MIYYMTEYLPLMTEHHLCLTELFQCMTEYLVCLTEPPKNVKNTNILPKTPSSNGNFEKSL